MQIEFDPAKDAKNQEKHGVSLGLAIELDWEAALVWVDARFHYGETRMIALAPTTGILYYVAFVDQSDVRRVISVRRAIRREVKYYVQNHYCPDISVNKFNWLCMVEFSDVISISATS